MCLQPGVDVGLSAEIITESRQKARSLNLDPIDTTTKELYYGLLSKAEKDDASLRTVFGIDANTKALTACSRISETATRLMKKEIVVALQPVAVKKILKAVPPKKTLKILKLRSIDSVLKRENPLIIYALAKKLEDKTWNAQILARLKRVQTGDVAESSVVILSLPIGWSEKINKLDFEQVVYPVPEIGAVLLIPMVPLQSKGSVLLTSALVFQAAQGLVVESLPYRTKALSRGYENLMFDISARTLEEIKPIYGLRPDWLAVYQLLATQTKKYMPEYELIIGDLKWESTETKLASICTDLDFWVNSHYLGVPNAVKPISFHLIDVAASLVMQKPFESQLVNHMQASIWNELQLRYMKQEVFEQSIISQMTIGQ
jgi:hypothetical protein